VIALGFENFGLAFWHFLAFLGEFGLEDFFRRYCYFWLYFGLSYTKVYRSATMEVTECAPTPISQFDSWLLTQLPEPVPNGWAN